jgi:hypothetical protein
MHFVHVGMSFDDIESVENFYKDYAHVIGFSVCGDRQKIDDNSVIQWKRYCCARHLYKLTKDNVDANPSKKVCHNRETRCGCDAFIYVKRNIECKYVIS